MYEKKILSEPSSKPPSKKPIIIIPNGFTDEQINKIINLKTN